jgi:catechol 2,3-dioxygenase-like lactoylglutathione lyase family enzyme
MEELMRWQGVHHVEFSVLDYEESVRFYDRMFGWLGYKSFWTLNIGYHSTYYMARFPIPHSYIGIQPAKSGGKVDYPGRVTGIHHIAQGRGETPEIAELGRGADGCEDEPELGSPAQVDTGMQLPVTHLISRSSSSANRSGCGPTRSV